MTDPFLMKNEIKILILVFVICLVATLITLKLKDVQSLNTDILTSPQKDTIIKSRLISGTILPSKEIKIVPQISGIIEEIYVTTGQKVKIGDKIARIKLIASPENMERAEKSLKIAELSYSIHEKDYIRNKQLFNDKVISASDYEKLENQWILSNEEVLSAKKQLQIVQEGFEDGKNGVSNIVKSTTNGIVLDIPLQVGSSVTERNSFKDGSTIARVADMNKLIFNGEVNEKDLSFLKEKMIFLLK